MKNDLQLKINHKNGIQAGWYELRKSLYPFLESNTGMILRYAKGTHKWVLENIEINITWDVLYFGLVALNRKLGFPSREIDIQWKKGKYNQKMLCFITKPSIYHYLFQSRNKVVKVLITSSTTFWKKLGVFVRKTWMTHT